MSAVDKLRNKINTMSGFNQDTVLSIMVLAREVIEEKKLVAHYGHLNFYSCWCVHSSMEQNPVCLEILKKLTDIFTSNPGKDPTLPWYPDAVAELMNLKKLRLQFIELFQSFQIPTSLFEKFEYWEHFTAYLRDILVSKPIRFKEASLRNSAAKTLYADLEKIAAGNNELAVKEVSVFTERSNGWKAYLDITQFRDHILLRVPFVRNEHRF